MEPILKFSIGNQKIFRTDDFHVVAKSKSYLHAEFSFLSDDWEGLTKTAIFDSGKPYSIVLKDNSCLVPWEALTEPGIMMVSVFGGDLITTDKASVRVHESGHVEGETPEPPTPSAYEQFVHLVEEIGEKASDSAGKAEKAAETAAEARNTSVEKANIAITSAEETEADKLATEENRAATERNKSEVAANLIESNRILQEQIQLLGAVPMIYAVTTLEELQAFTGAKDGDFGIIQEPRAMLFRYYTTGADGQPLSQPAWQWMTDLYITFTKESLLSILTLPAVATSGKYADLLEIPNRYNSPIVLDGTADTITWDYTQSDTALVTLTTDKPLTITGDYNGCRATLDVYGAKLILDDVVYLKSATYSYLEAVEGEHYHYEFQKIIDKWQVGMMVVDGAGAGENV